MKLLDFLTLNENEQYETLFKKGALVAVVEEKPITKKLYCLNTFFVELHLHHKTKNILFKKIFKEGELLDQYLDDFNLKS